MKTEALCQPAEWDSRFFGRRIARATLPRLTAAHLRAIQEWCRHQDIECVYLLADADDPETIRLAEGGGFKLVDIRVALVRRPPYGERIAPAGAAAVRVRPWRDGDLPALEAMAATLYRGATRFYRDPHFPAASCDRLYAVWIERECHGLADQVLVAERGSRIVGYVSCHRRGKGEGQLGLVGVHGDEERSGIGRQLVDEACDWLRQHDAGCVRVVTQGQNVKAQRVYQRCGFVTESLQLWYHGWFAADAGAIPV